MVPRAELREKPVVPFFSDFSCSVNIAHELLQAHVFLSAFQLSLKLGYLLCKCHSFPNFNCLYFLWHTKTWPFEN